jgi:putative salt-induced outer membrane protein
MKKIFLILFLLTAILKAEILTEAEGIKENKRLIDAKKREAKIKAEIKVATEKLKAVQKIIEEELSKYLRFSSHTELGYIATSGNTDTTTGSIDMTGKMMLRDHTLKLDIDYIYGKEAAIESRNKLHTETNYDYKFSKYFALNYLVGYKDDKFSGFDYQLYTGPGIKYIPIKSDNHELNVQLNILYSVDQETDKYYDSVGTEIKYPYVSPSKDQAVSTTEGKKKEYSSLLLKGDYTWKISKSVKFIQEMSYRTDPDDGDNYFINTKSSLLTKINATMSMGINYKVDYVNTPPAGNQYTDNTLSITLGIDF